MKPEATSALTSTKPLRADAQRNRDTLLAAVRGGFADRVARMASPAAVRQLNRVDVPSGLVLTTCEDDLCSWSNESGERVTMTFDAAKLGAGAQQAVTGVKVATS